MKDYSKSLEERREFILSYEIKDEQIIINLAKGEPYPIPYTEENLKKVDEKMKFQVRRATGKRKRNFIFFVKNLATSKIRRIFALAFERYLSSVVEQWTENPRVPGSIPGGTTSKTRSDRLPAQPAVFLLDV